MAGVKGKSGTNPNSQAHLTNINERTTPEQRRANASKAGKASAKAKRQRKELREMFEYICSLGVEKGKIVEDIKSLADAEGKNITVGMEIALAQVNKARDGDTRAAEFIRDTMGQKPTNKQEITATIVDSPLTSILAQLQDDGDDTDGRD